MIAAAVLWSVVLQAFCLFYMHVADSRGCVLHVCFPVLVCTLFGTIVADYRYVYCTVLLLVVQLLPCTIKSSTRIEGSLLFLSSLEGVSIFVPYLLRLFLLVSLLARHCRLL